MIKPVAVNNILVLKKDRSYIKDNSDFMDMGCISKNISEIPEPYTGIIDSIGMKDINYRVGDHVIFSDIGGLYLEFGEMEYVVITPEMVIGVLEE